MAKKNHTLGGIAFSSKDKIKQYIQFILNTTAERDFIGGTEKAVVLDLLQWHPKAQEKIGPGVDAIQVVRHTPWSPGLGFSLHRVDGTVIDFSYRACLEPHRSAHTTAVPDAFRNAVVGQTSTAKRELISQFCRSDGMVWSQAELKWLKPSEVELDHHPSSFSGLMREFLDGQQLNLEDVALVDDGIQCHIASETLRAAWEIFHHDNAEYRLISGALNSRLGNQGHPRSA